MKKRPIDKNIMQHVSYAFVLLIIVTTFIALGHYNINMLRDDYNKQISALNQELNKLNQELDMTKEEYQDLFEDKQKEIDKLSLKIIETNQKIEDTNEQYTAQFQEIKDTTDIYESQIGKLNQQLSDLVVESESFSKIISEVIDSVVSINTNIGQGSGAIFSSNGYVVTNYHVIQGVRRASVMTYDGDIYSISLVGYDKTNDLAILKIISNETFDYFEFGNSDILKVGQKVVALGNPAGLSFTATEGIISSASRIADDGLDYIQTDVTLNPGNSGGPLINSQGQIIGIANFKVAGYEGLGFAIPSNRVEEVIEKIME